MERNFASQWERSSLRRASIKLITPSPRGLSNTTSASFFTEGRALATAALSPDILKNGRSFSASPTPTTFDGEMRNSRRAAWSPVRLSTPEGSTMTDSLLKITCRSRPRSRIAESITVSCGRQVATTVRPAVNGTSLSRSSSRNRGFGGSQSSFSLPDLGQ